MKTKMIGYMSSLDFPTVHCGSEAVAMTNWRLTKVSTSQVLELGHEWRDPL